MAKRNLQVQTPGETPVTPPEGDQAPAHVQTTESTPTPPETPAEKPAEPPKAAKKPAERPSYATMAAADIDPFTLTAPVLSRDGWVVPAKKD